MNNFIKEHFKSIIGVVLALSAGYAGYKELQHDMAINQRRLQTYIKVIKSQGETIHKQDVRISVLEAIKCK